MAWFKFYDNQSTPNSYAAPLRRILDLSELNQNIYKDSIIAVSIEDIVINKKITSSLSSIYSDDSYIVIYEDEDNQNYFIPVKSLVKDNYLYFKLHENYSYNSTSKKYYSIYYGFDNLSKLQKITDNVYIKPSTPEVATANFKLDLSEISSAIKLIDSNGYNDYSLAYYDNGISWKDGVSKTIGAKAFGFFNGPYLYIKGSKTSNSGTFKIRIFSIDQKNSISKNLVLDWIEIDCYSANNLYNQNLFSKTDLDKNKYFFEIETLSKRNNLSSSTNINITGYSFMPDYGLSLSSEEIYSEISFKRIGGIR